MMKKLFMLMIASCSVFAAPGGNPSAPRILEEGFFIPKEKKFSVRLGYEGDYVGDAKLDQTGPGSGRVDTYAQESNSGAFTINMLNRMDIYTVLGSSRTNADWRFTVNDTTSQAQVETLYDFIWGVGARGILLETDNFCLGLGGRYENSHYDNLWMTIDGVVQKVNGSYLDWRVWQLEANVSYKIDIFTPYIGLKYSNVKTTIGNFDFPVANNGGGTNDFENRIPVGIFIGCTLSSGKYFMLSVEGRLVDEEAVTVSGDLRF